MTRPMRRPDGLMPTAPAASTDGVARTAEEGASPRLLPRAADPPESEALAETDYFTNPPPRRVGALGLLTRGPCEFVIIRRTYWSPVSRWGLPGGSVAPNERPWAGLSRLIEAKLSLRSTATAFLGIDHAPTKPGHYEEGVNFLYHVPIPNGVEPLPVVETGYVEARWVTPESVGELVVDHELLRIVHCLDVLRTRRPKELVLGVPQHEQPLVQQALSPSNM
ncbi:NUDIX hydrolase [Streptomyces lasiicapitis]|uniref:NUDIX hydrolase n=1 Tax=Streptomyces lasiicapitis TaxID=1923961 RepID=UPI0036540769